jgi:hypothetical protein
MGPAANAAGLLGQPAPGPNFCFYFSKKKIILFLKKKKQKDFYAFSRDMQTARFRNDYRVRRINHKEQKSFCFFFFRKRRLFLYSAGAASGFPRPRNRSRSSVR